MSHNMIFNTLRRQKPAFYSYGLQRLLRHGRKFWLPRDFGAEHFAVSMQVGEQVLFPRVRAAKADEIIVASGTSCRHQIEDGTGRKAMHVVEVILEALK